MSSGEGGCHTISTKLLLSEGVSLLEGGRLTERQADFVNKLVAKARRTRLPFVAVSKLQLTWWAGISPSCRRAVG